MLVVRVAFGDPKYLKDEYTGRLPPYRDPANPSKGRYDSVVANPADSPRGQAHRQFVLFDSARAFPEMLVTYRC